MAVAFTLSPSASHLVKDLEDPGYISHELVFISEVFVFGNHPSFKTMLPLARHSTYNYPSSLISAKLSYLLHAIHLGDAERGERHLFNV